MPYDKIITGDFPLSNWRPSTVRLAGYLGINGPRDGVFDMDFGISNAIFSLILRCKVIYMLYLI